MSLLKKKRVLAAKIETTAGTAIALTASDGAFNVFDAEMTPEIELAERPGQSAFSQLTAEPGALGGSCSFKTELDSAWSAILLPACGLVGTPYVPVSEVPGTNAKTITLGIYENGLCKKLKGAMGNAVFVFESGKPVQVEWTFTGIWIAPVDTVMLAPTFPTSRPPRFMGAGLEIGSWTTAVIQSLRIDLGNTVMLRESGNSSDGYVYAAITDRKVVGSINPESGLVATKDVFGEWIIGTEAAFTLTVSGITFAMPKLQFTNIQPGDREGIQTDEIDFQANRSASAGNDEITITFGSPTTTA